MIFGWGSKKKDIVVDSRTHVVVVRSFFHIMFAFSAAWDRQFILARLTESGWATQGITEEQAAQLCGGQAPDIHPWWRFSLLGVLGLSVTIGVLSSLF